VGRPQWDDFWRELVDNHIVEPRDRQQFDASFTNTGRQNAQPRPGIACIYSWQIADAVTLDARSELALAVRTRLNEMLKALGAPPIDV
jgi:hypothetical protein